MINALNWYFQQTINNCGNKHFSIRFAKCTNTFEAHVHTNKYARYSYNQETK